ncbi:RNA-binding protein [bacterium]|nr:RNA-binding protein [bacterium]MBU1982890.1 RNA-binding protein [bacterium]
MTNIYVGNLAFTATEDDLRAAFEEFGTVERVAIIVDRLTGRSRGFGFVEMPNDEDAKTAIAGLHDRELNGRKLLVREARPKTENPSEGRPNRE